MMQGPLKAHKPVRRTRPDNCVDCGVRLMTRRPYIKPPEGYEWHQGHGMCGTCYERARYRASAPSRCTDCGRLFRSRHEAASDHPGTILHVGRGLCKHDYETRRKNGTLPPRIDGGECGSAAPQPQVDLEAAARLEEHVRGEVIGYILERRKRTGWADMTLHGIKGLERLWEPR
ncbi:MAG: hypothetical protein ACTHJM_02865 [Marmoricola sp.]